jgi:hypothetical protein
MTRKGKLARILQAFSISAETVTKLISQLKLNTQN